MEVEIEPGRDAGQSWGPGIALIWPDGKAAKLNARLEDMRFGLFAGDTFEIAGGPIQRDQRLTIRILLGDDSVFFQQRSAAGKWLELGVCLRAGLQGDPVILKLGKHAPEGTWRDHSAPGAAGDCAILGVRVFGK